MMDSRRSEKDEILQRIGSDNGKELSIPVRKLASLWEMKGVPEMEKEEILEMINDSEMGRKERSLKSSKLGTSQISDPFYSPMSERMGRSKVEMSHRRRPSSSSQKVVQSDYLTEADDDKRTHENSQTRNLLKDVCHSLTTSKQLLKVLSRVCCIEEQKSTCVALFTTLKSELDRACIQVTKLIKEQKNNKGEIDTLLKWFEEQKIVWKMKEQCKIQSALTSVVGELKTEKKLRKQAERLNKKLGRELSDTKASLTMAVKEVESQKRAMEVLERVCEELAKGVGEDKTKFEDLKREREEVEKEREMLQLADILREERVQMKLSEAKYQFEEKTAVLEKLKNEMESYLSSKNGEGSVSSQSPNIERINAIKKHFRETLPAGPEKEKEESDSADDSDLHSIELNMEENSKSNEWRNTNNISTCQERQTSDAIEWEFSNGGLFESGSLEAWKNDYEDEIERYNMIKDLRDHIVSASKIVPSQDFVSPT